MSDIGVRGFEHYLSKLKAYLPYAEDEEFSWEKAVGLLIMQLSNTDTVKSNKQNKSSNATQIQLTGEKAPNPGESKSEDFFPTFTLNRTFKGWRISLPAKINLKNICALDGTDFTGSAAWQDDTIQIRRRILNESDSSVGNPALQICYGNDLMPIRNVLDEKDYLVIVKLIENPVYYVFGVKSSIDLGTKKRMYKSPKADDDSTVFSFSTIVGNNEASKANSLPGENILLYGVPGSGKSHFIRETYPAPQGCIQRVVFHPEYTYSDFIGQILPRLKKTEDDSEKLVYEFVPGPFTKILHDAVNDEDNTYYLVIEEINRGNAPAIFGEVFQLLDRDQTGVSEYTITNYDIAKVVYNGDENHAISLPKNLWLLATMNTSDQNVFTLDTAFQRRWIMRHIDNDVCKAEHSKQLIAGSAICWGAFAEVTNEEVVNSNDGLVSSEDKRLGAYFATARELGKDRFPEKVLKYLWDDAFKMSRDNIFASGLTTLDKVISTFKASQEDSLKAVLKDTVFNKMLTKTSELVGESIAVENADDTLNSDNGDNNA